MASLGQIPQVDHPSPVASTESPLQGVQIILEVQQVVDIYTVLALTFGNYYFRNRRPRKKQQQQLRLKYLENSGKTKKTERSQDTRSADPLLSITETETQPSSVANNAFMIYISYIYISHIYYMNSCNHILYFYKCIVLLSSLIFSLHEPVGLGTCVMCVYLFTWLCAQIHVGVAAYGGQRLETCLYLSILCTYIFLDKGSH